MLNSIKSKVVIKKEVDCTEEWINLSGLKRDVASSVRIKKDVFRIKSNGEIVELHKYGINHPDRGRVEMFYLVLGDKIPTKIYKLVSKGGSPDKKLIKDAMVYIYTYLLKRTEELKVAKEKEEESMIIDVDKLYEENAEEDEEVLEIEDIEEEETIEI